MKFDRQQLIAGVMIFLLSSVLLAAENPLLKFVPANTLFFSGNTQQIDLNDYPLVNFSPSFEMSLNQTERNALGVELKFLYELYLDLQATLAQGSSALLSHYGWSEKISMVLYSVGATPVFKMTLDNEQALLKVLDQAEEKSGYKHQNGQFSQLNFRTYPLGKKHQLIVALQQDHEAEQKLVTIALVSNTLSAKQRQIILGLSLPENSIVDTAKVTRIEQENHYLPVSVSFLDFQELVRSLFQENENPWFELMAGKAQAIKGIQASECQADVMTIAKNMPRLIAGYNQYQLQDSAQGQQVSIEFEALLELKNQRFKTELQNFRGFIPEHIRNGSQDHILAFALGVNLSQISPLFVYITEIFRESTFKCPQLIEIQNTVAKFNPMMLALVTGVVEGVQGISFALQDFSMVQKTTAQEITDHESKTSNEMSGIANKNSLELSALVSLAAENPLRVWQMLAAFSPLLTQNGALIVPMEEPQKLTIPELETLGIELYVVLKGKHLILYSGIQAAMLAEKLTNESLKTNGFIQETVNYTKLRHAVENLHDYLSQPEHEISLPAEACIYFDESIAMLSRFSGAADLQSDFNDRGWLSRVKVDLDLKDAMEKKYLFEGNIAGQYEIFYVQDGCQLLKDGLDEMLSDGSGFYQQYSEDEQCFIFETRYRWLQQNDRIKLQYLSERSRAEGLCSNEFSDWAIPSAEYINDSCQLRTEQEGHFSCLYQWDGVLNKAVYKRM